MKTSRAPADCSPRCSPAAARRRTCSSRPGSKQVTLMLDYFPNADHAGIYAAQAGGHFKQAGLDVEIRQPADPAAPIKQVAAGRVDLADLLRAGGAAGARRGPERGQRRRDRPEAAHLDHLAAGGEDPQARRPEGQDRRHGGHRLPVRLPADDPRRGERAARLGQGAQRRLQPHPGAAHREGGRRAGRLLELRGHGAAGSRASARASSASTRPACRPTTSWCWWPTRTRSTRDGGKLRAFIGALSRGVRDLRADPDQAIEGLLEANPDLDPELQRAAVKVTLPLFSRRRASRSAGRTPSEWDAFGAWMQEKNLLEQPAGRALVLRQRAAAGLGAVANRPGIGGGPGA